MKERALEIARSADNNLLALSKLREYLQHVTMRELFDLDVLEELVFHGGTALRFLHGLQRFSEDLDFHTEEPDPDWRLEPELESLKTQIEYQGYTVDYSDPTDGHVKSSFLKFERLKYEAGLSNHEEEKLRIKLEVDTNPPADFGVDTTSINRFFPYVVHHHDMASFMAGKLHAIFQRDWSKGRDFYDLWFYLTREDAIEPNIPYLRNALEQTGYSGEQVTADNWKKLTRKRVEATDWDQVKSDVEPFLLRPSDLKAFRKDLLLSKLDTQ
jgi:predicted nucleotidyltransferase component of viral defense system